MFQDQLVDRRLYYASLIIGVAVLGLFVFAVYRVTRPEPIKLNKKARMAKKNR